MVAAPLREGGDTSLRPKGTIGSGEQSFTFTNNLLDLQDENAIIEDAYRYGNKVFRIVLTNQATQETKTFAYDLYHTGVFNYYDGNSGEVATTKSKTGWYYYEVIFMGRNYWLDRNLGASEASYTGEDALGGLYRIANTPSDNQLTLLNETDLKKFIPTGFRVPTASEWQTLISDPKFGHEFIDGQYVTRYETGEPDQGTVYFPRNGMWWDNAAAGSTNTGYYWTQTEALGASGNQRGWWLQNVQLVGANATFNRYRIQADNTQNWTGMSLRCVYDSRVAEVKTTIQFSVKGYTHVYLYTKDEADNVVPLNTYPGDMISIFSGKDSQYWPFKLETMLEVDLNNLFVQFVTVDDSNNISSSSEIQVSDYTQNGTDYYKYDGNWQRTN